MYSGLVFLVLPGAAVLTDTAWLLLMMVPLFAYLQLVVIVAEEAMLTEEFGDVSRPLAARAVRFLHWCVCCNQECWTVWRVVHRNTNSSAWTYHVG